MATFTKTLLAFGLASWALAAFSAPSEADTYDHIDRLAVSIDRQAKQIVKETRHYRHTPEYRHLVLDALQMSRQADHLHELAHHHGSLSHLESDLNELDSTFHHLESLFDRIERQAGRGHGHVHGHTSHVRELLISIEDNIHHLQDDLRSLRGPTYHTSPVVVPAPVLRPQPYRSQWGGYNSRPYDTNAARFHNHNGHRGHDVHRQRTRSRGITIGGGSSRIRLQF